MNTDHELAREMSCHYTPDQIRNRIAWIRWNLANPAPACRRDRDALNAARKDAAKALRIYRAALRMIPNA